jgi:hypothetical protein
MRFYEAYNERDLDTIASLIADDIVYSDLVYEEPHEGREGVMDWLNKVGGWVGAGGGAAASGHKRLYLRPCQLQLPEPGGSEEVRLE